MGTTTSNTPAQGAQGSTTSNPAAQLAQALGLPHLLAQAPTVAANLATWVAGTSTGRRGITVQGAYLAAAAVAQVLNGGQPPTPGHIAATYLALGGVAPGRGNATGYGASNGYTLMHSAYYGANKHMAPLGGVQHGTGTAQGAPTWAVPSAVLAQVQLPPGVAARLLAGWGQGASAQVGAATYLAQYASAPCGCNAKGKAGLAAIAAGNKPNPGGHCGTGRKLGSGQFAKPVPTAQGAQGKPSKP